MRTSRLFPRSARPSGAVVDLGPEHDARLFETRDLLHRPRRGRRAHSREGKSAGEIDEQRLAASRAQRPAMPAASRDL